VLCYHEVSQTWESSLAVTPELFQVHLRWLRRHRRLVSLAEAVDRLDNSARLPSGYAAITFDDGFTGLYAHARLIEERVPATVFIVAQSLTNEGITVHWVDDPPEIPLHTLSLDQVLEMQEAGVSFGSHSLAHRDLTKLSFEDCRRDVKESRELLEDLLGTRVPFVAYPGGLHTESVRRAAQRAGFSHGFTLERVVSPSDPLCIPRIGVYAGNESLALRAKSSRLYLTIRPYLGPF